MSRFQGGYSRVQYARATKRGGSIYAIKSNHWIDQHAEPAGMKLESVKHFAEWLEANPFNPEARHTPESLDMYASALLAPTASKDGILLNCHLRERASREIYNANGLPDPNIVVGIYNRTHPAGRKFSTPEERKSGRSFYR